MNDKYVSLNNLKQYNSYVYSSLINDAKINTMYSCMTDVTVPGSGDPYVLELDNVLGETSSITFTPGSTAIQISIPVTHKNIRVIIKKDDTTYNNKIIEDLSSSSYMNLDSTDFFGESGLTVVVYINASDDAGEPVTTTWDNNFLSSTGSTYTTLDLDNIIPGVLYSCRYITGSSITIKATFAGSSRVSAQRTATYSFSSTPQTNSIVNYVLLDKVPEVATGKVAALIYYRTQYYNYVGVVNLLGGSSPSISVSTTTNAIGPSNYVNTNGVQTITAKKTFSVLPESSVTPTTDNQLVNKAYVDAQAGGSTYTAGDGINITNNVISSVIPVAPYTTKSSPFGDIQEYYISFDQLKTGIYRAVRDTSKTIYLRLPINRDGNGSYTYNNISLTTDSILIVDNTAYNAYSTVGYLAANSTITVIDGRVIHTYCLSNVFVDSPTGSAAGNNNTWSENYMPDYVDNTRTLATDFWYNQLDPNSNVHIYTVSATIGTLMVAPGDMIIGNPKKSITGQALSPKLYSYSTNSIYTFTVTSGGNVTVSSTVEWVPNNLTSATGYSASTENQFLTHDTSGNLMWTTISNGNGVSY